MVGADSGYADLEELLARWAAEQRRALAAARHAEDARPRAARTREVIRSIARRHDAARPPLDRGRARRGAWLMPRATR